MSISKDGIIRSKAPKATHNWSRTKSARILAAVEKNLSDKRFGIDDIIALVKPLKGEECDDATWRRKVTCSMEHLTRTGEAFEGRVLGAILRGHRGQYMSSRYAKANNLVGSVEIDKRLKATARLAIQEHRYATARSVFDYFSVLYPENVSELIEMYTEKNLKVSC